MSFLFDITDLDTQFRYEFFFIFNSNDDEKISFPIFAVSIPIFEHTAGYRNNFKVKETIEFCEN